VPAAHELHAAAPVEPPPKVVDVSSLSIEHAAPRAQPRAAVATAAKASEPQDESSASEQTEPAAQTAPSATPKLKNGDLPAAAHANPYTGGATDDSSVKKPVAPSDDEPGL
jgi:hypothetical protein